MQISRIVTPLAREVDRLAAIGSLHPNITDAGGDGGELRRETMVRALIAAAALAAPSTDYVCEALGAAALVSQARVTRMMQ